FFAPWPRRLRASQLHLRMCATILIHVEDLLIDTAERAAAHTMLDAARADAQRGSDAERVNLRARRQQFGDGELVQIATGEDTHAAHARLCQFCADIFAIGHDVAAV